MLTCRKLVHTVFTAVAKYFNALSWTPVQSIKDFTVVRNCSNIKVGLVFLFTADRDSNLGKQRLHSAERHRRRKSNATHAGMVQKYAGEDALAYQEGPSDPAGPVNYVQKRLQKRKGVEVVFDPKGQK